MIILFNLAFLNITSSELTELIKCISEFVLNENTIKVLSEQIGFISSDMFDKDIHNKLKGIPNALCVGLIKTTCFTSLISLFNFHVNISTY